MRKIEEYENKMVHNGKRNERFVYIDCNYCGEFTWKKWTSRIKKGDNQYCNKECYDESQKGKVYGKEHARSHYDKRRNVWYVQWWEQVDGKDKLRNTTKARWLWEIKYGELDRKHVVTFIDGDSNNCVLENLKMITRSESNSVNLMGHKVSDEAKENMSKAHKGKKLSQEHKKNIGRATKRGWEDGTFGSDEYREKLSKSLSGKNNPRWIDGRSKRDYSKDFYNMRSPIRDRDKHMCKSCDNKVKGMSGVIHHIDGDKTNDDPFNLVLLCRTCHNRVHNKSKNVNPMIMVFRSMLQYDKGE